MDIVIYMNEEDFLHKTGALSEVDGESGAITAFWSMGRIPRYFTEDDKIFLAMKGHVMGYVECEEFNPEDINGETIVWDSDTFLYIESIPCKQFRGFRYRKFEYKLEASKEKQRSYKQEKN